jgi:DNA-binding NarL/FixJ family response regulator
MPEIATQNRVISVAVVDDDANVRHGLWWLLNNIAGLRCAGAFTSCREFLATSAEPPDILLLDVSMPETSGIDGIPPIKRKFPATKIIMHSNFDDEDKIARSRRAGARGYVLKNASAPQLYETILHVHRGGAAWPPGFEQEEPRLPGFTAFLNALIRKARAVFNASPKIR